MTVKLKLTTAVVTQALRERYCPPHELRAAHKWAFIQEVRNGAAFDANRSCDAIAMSLWPSQGLHIHGHEIKVSRADWRKEMDDPTKAEAFSRYMHYWWVVAPKGIVEINELPATWGLMEVNDKHVVRVSRPATINPKPEPISYGFLASLLRRSIEQDELTLMLRKAREQGYSEGKAATEYRVKSLEQEIKRERENRHGGAEAVLKEFREASGFALSQWDAERYGNAARLLMQLKPMIAASQLAGLSVQAGKLAKALETIFPPPTRDE